ncbi:MAG: endolytic transglycosylase MltG [Brevinema sp.]
MKPFLLTILLFLTACGSTMNNQDVIFHVRNGDTVSSIGLRLKEQGLINDTFSFRLASRIYKPALKRGNYTILPQTSYKELFILLSSGRGSTIPVTFAEGLTSFDFARILEENNISSSNDFINEISNTTYLSRYNIPPHSAQTLEGYLFPDTYYFEANTPTSLVIQTILNRFNQIISPEIKAEIARKGSSLHNILTMASIVQKESGGNSEMRLISGVYNRRLKIGMPLQADPTLIYALILDGVYDGNIRTRHLRPPYPHPYNTYYRKGLPPGPIASPGKNAILAALNPEPTTFLYFVGKADGSGTHQFSKTLVEHNAAVRRYQLGIK